MTVRFSIKSKFTSRPICVCCGKAYGARWTEEVTEFYQKGATEPVYRGNLKVMRTRDDPWGSAQRRVLWTVWDGETFVTPYNPFCTLRCALSFARAAYETGTRLIANTVIRDGK